jgi:glycosyltransferase involved in cell wall biosynthesis
MDRQTVKADQWIVADDGTEEQPTTAGQQVIRRQRSSEGAQSLADNILAAIDHVKGEFVGIIENDDYYLPEHIEYHVEQLKHYPAAGGIWLNYYNLEHKGYRVIRNVCSALCNTFMRVEVLEDLRAAAIECRKKNDYNIDQHFWSRVGQKGLHNKVTVIGLKGLPGRKGLGVGHRPKNLTPDADYEMLKRWLGDDASIYIP